MNCARDGSNQQKPLSSKMLAEVKMGKTPAAALRAARVGCRIIGDHERLAPFAQRIQFVAPSDEAAPGPSSVPNVQPGAAPSRARMWLFMARGSLTFRKTDIARAIQAVRDQGLDIVTVRVLPDGAIDIVTKPPKPNDLDQELETWRANHGHA
jgi:hypothetical protein